MNPVFFYIDSFNTIETCDANTLYYFHFTGEESKESKPLIIMVTQLVNNRARIFA